MIQVIRSISLLLLLVASITARAQAGCPPGQYPISGPGWSYCAPVPGYDSANGQSAAPRAQNKWLSLAIDPAKGILGAAVSTVSQSESERAATKECARQGGTACTVDITQINGCVAMVTGKDFLNTRGGATKNEAVQKSMAACEAKDSQCTVYYSACELPTQVE
jgi:Domain of unknown function (DUF4189)